MRVRKGLTLDLVLQVKIELKGIEKFKRELGKVKSDITRELEQHTSASLIKIQSDAKRGSAVDTGRLRASIHKRQEGTSGDVFTNVEYAPYIEFGTGSLVSVPDELKDYALQFKGRGLRNVNLPARPFMYPAFVKERPKYIRNLGLTLGKARTV